MALPDRALQTLDLMVQKRIGERPLLFICHSLGGLLAKQILRTSSDATDPHKQSVVNQTRGVLFLATPHSGASLASLASSFNSVFRTTISVEGLRAHDPHLRDLYNWYRNHSSNRGIKTITYYELRSVGGVLPIVNPTSAHPGVGSDPVGLDEDHVSIAKPRDPAAQICEAARDITRSLLGGSSWLAASSHKHGVSQSVAHNLPLSASKNILAVFANPRTTNHLRLGEEDRVIREAIQRSKHRDRLSLTVCHAATIHDLRRALLDHEFDVVHISGHDDFAGLVMETESGVLQVVPQDALSDLFAEYASPNGKLQCVVLNSCYSLSTGRFTALNVPHTIAMEGPISDIAAIEFSRGFYDALGAGKDFPHAYREGDVARRSAAAQERFVAYLLHRGQIATPDDASKTFAERAPSQAETRLLIGFALDLSDSMRSNIRNDRSGATTRLAGFRESLRRLADDTRIALKDMERESESDRSTVDVFVHGFGLRHKAVKTCDLLTLLRLADDLVSEDEIERLKQYHSRIVEGEYRRTASQYSGLSDLARRYGFGGAVRQAEESARRSAEQEVRHRVLTDIASRVTAKLDAAGPTTLNIGELASMWEKSESSFIRLEEFIYGATPMTAAMREINGRFKVELKRRNAGSTSLLFIVSDGEPTDGDPLPSIRSIKDQGIIVVACFVTGADLANPRTLYGSRQSTWSRGAQLMFDAASELDQDSEMARFLLRKGWSLHPEARLFVQINHSDVLDEFIRVLVAPLQSKPPEWQLPIGE